MSSRLPSFLSVVRFSINREIIPRAKVSPIDIHLVINKAKHIDCVKSLHLKRTPPHPRFTIYNFGMRHATSPPRSDTCTSCLINYSAAFPPVPAAMFSPLLPPRLQQSAVALLSATTTTKMAPVAEATAAVTDPETRLPHHLPPTR